MNENRVLKPVFGSWRHALDRGQVGQGALELNPYKSSFKKKVIQDKRLAVFSLLQLFGRMRLLVTAEATMSCINDTLVFTLQKKCGRTTSEGA